MSRFQVVVAVAAAGSFVVAGVDPAAALPDFRTVALSGDQAPDAAAGVVFSSFSTSVLNNAGQTAFRAIVTGPGVDASNNSGIYSEGSGALAQVAGEGEQAPDAAAGVVFRSFSTPVLNAAGQTAFDAFLTGSGVDASNNQGIYSEGSGALAQVARKGEQAPDAAAGVVFFGFFPPVLNAAGQTAFGAFLTGPGVDFSNRNGIYSEGSGGLAQVAREGEQAPDAAPGVVFRGFITAPVLNVAGQTAFVALLTGPGVGVSINGGIYSEGSGALTQVAREGEQAPQAAAAVVFSGFDAPMLNAAGQTAFSASLTGAGVGGSNNGGIYSDRSGALAPVAREGEQAPDATAGVAFSNFGSPVLNSVGQTAFRASLTGPGVDFSNRNGMYSEGRGGLAQVARSGGEAPDAAAGVVFSSFDDPVLNAAGQTAFVASLTGPGVDSSNDRGIYATDLDGLLVEIAREGDLFDVDDDPLIEDLRTIDGLSLVANSGNGEGRRSGFNDLGQVAFQASFTDGSEGIFVSNLVAIPEPASLVLLGLGGLAVCWWRRFGVVRQ